jgi:hypothetical protein
MHSCLCHACTSNRPAPELNRCEELPAQARLVSGVERASGVKHLPEAVHRAWGVGGSLCSAAPRPPHMSCTTRETRLNRFMTLRESCNEDAPPCSCALAVGRAQAFLPEVLARGDPAQTGLAPTTDR